MKSIGVRELQQRASEYLKEVEAGRTLEVTSRGRPVARLVPIRATTDRQRLIERGRLVRGIGDLLDLGRPLSPSRGVSLQALGRCALAQECFQSALAVQPNFPEAFNNLANVLQQSGQSAAAIEAWRNRVPLRGRRQIRTDHVCLVLRAVHHHLVMLEEKPLQTSHG